MSRILIHKYELKNTDIQTISLPVGAVPLSVGMQGFGFFLWASFPMSKEASNPALWRPWQVYRAHTGGIATIPDDALYLGMIQDGTDGAYYVTHWYFRQG